MSQQQAVEITAKLYQCREQQIFLGGEDGFIQMFDKWKPVVEAAMNKHQCSELPALIELLKLAESKPDGGMMMHVLNAVVCEMLEPTVTAH
ncbi:hypothetical protein [Pseudoalteromonas piratica]|uniref:Uncharacterized protein n=1 Tax=Pseudoalteromonas piratica TaxID=1348114 RepID=A0A0A7EF09_9GAMM|nr:hypothetical protein [Pseudoalteromonas piratica]AIY65209.1 hypothetical protein OM33_08575 [Pseudoalteromonas piratica]